MRNANRASSRYIPDQMQIPRGEELYAAILVLGAVIIIWGGLAVMLVRVAISGRP
jgi:hypothetical protein